MTFLLLREGHLQRLLQRIGDLGSVVWIDYDGFRQFLGSAGHFAKNQHTTAARRDILLRHKVHSVAQRGDQAYVAHRIESQQRRKRHVAILIDDRRPADAPEPAIDLAD